MAPPPDPRLDWRVEYVPLFEMTCVSRVSDPPCGFRLPAISERPSPLPRATAGTPTARMSVLMRIAFMHPATTRGERSCARVSRVTSGPSRNVAPEIGDRRSPPGVVLDP